MQPVWLIEAGVYGAEVQALLAEIRRQGMAAELIPYSALKKGSQMVIDGRPIGPTDCVIGYGTYPFSRQIQLHHRWAPGAWCTPETLDCTAYYAYFGKFLLNQNYAIMPGVEAIRQRDWLFSTFAKDGEVFSRPTGCQKLFVGRSITRAGFVDALAPTRYDPTTLVVVATPRPIAREWRLVVAGDRVIASSQYADATNRAIQADCPVEVREFTAAMLAEIPWRPDPIFMLDLCESEGHLWLVELNSFSCSWLYQCDPAAVVADASRLASQAWASGDRSSCREVSPPIGPSS